MKALARYLGGFLLAAALLVWVLRGADPDAIWAQLRQTSLPMLCLAAGLNIGSLFFRVWRWGALLHPIRPRVAFRPMFDAVILGYMISWIVPGRLGELVRPALLSGREGVPLGPCMGTVLADRLLDGMAIVLLFGLGVAITPVAADASGRGWLVKSAVVAAALMIVLLAFLLAASVARERLERLLDGRHPVVGWLGRSLLAVAAGMDSLKHPQLLARVAAHTLLVWAAIAVSTWCGVLACGVDVPLGAIFIILPLLALGIALPTPGGAGGYHAAMTLGLREWFAVSEPAAVGTSFVVHAALVVPMILLGAVVLLVGRIPLQDLLAAARQVRDLGSSGAAARPVERLS